MRESSAGFSRATKRRRATSDGRFVARPVFSFTAVMRDGGRARTDGTGSASSPGANDDRGRMIHAFSARMYHRRASIAVSAMFTTTRISSSWYVEPRYASERVEKRLSVRIGMNERTAKVRKEHCGNAILSCARYTVIPILCTFA